MRKQVKLLENYPDVRSDDFDILEISCQFDVVDNDCPLLVFLKAVDTTN